MTRIVVIGGTGYAGSAVVKEAVVRGLDVTSFSRSLPAESVRVSGATYKTGSVLDPSAVEPVLEGVDVVVSTLSPRGELDGHILEADQFLASSAAAAGARLIVVGGFSSLRPQEGAAPFAEGDDIPPQFAGEAKQMHAVLTHLSTAPEPLDWVFVSPAQQFGSYVPGEALGRYRIGGDVAIADEQGVSAVSGADFALAIVDEIATPAHRRAHISVAY